MERRHPRRRVALGGASAALVLMGATCADFGSELLEAAGAGALDQVNHRLYDEGGWSSAQGASRRGVGVATRGAATRPDCAGVEDEFESLYAGEILANPRRFASTLDGAVSRDALAGSGASALRLSGPRAGGAVAVVATSGGHLAKFVFRFGEGTLAPLRIRDLRVFDANGEELWSVVEPMDVPPRAALDLDPAGTGAAGDGFDIDYGPDPRGVATLRAIGGAGLSVPTTSLCP